MRLSTLTLSLFILTIKLAAQTNPVEACANMFSSSYLHANQARAPISNIGAFFYHAQDGFTGYHVPYQSNNSSAPTIFLNGLWIGAKNQAGNVKVAVTDYGVNAANNIDFWPGPLNESGETDAADCNNWNRIWSVRKYEINNHLVEYLTNGTVPFPAANILTWPGRGNPYFEAEMGFELGEPQNGLAPFFDQNADGIYDPKKGDYPRPEAAAIIPDQIMWAVFNDQGGGAIHGASNGQPLQVEVQVTAWAFDCLDKPSLSKSIFGSYKIINKSAEALDSVYIGLFQDADISCFHDDAVGCNEDLATTFYYNFTDSDDGVACNGPTIPDFATNKPVNSLTFLNKPLTNFVALIPGCFGFQLSGPAFYWAMQSKPFSSHLTYGEDGCNPNNPPTNLAFPGDPNNASEWSMLSAGIQGADAKSISSTFVGTLQPGAQTVLDFAFSFHRKPNGNNLSNITEMYAEVAEIRSAYELQFADVCEQNSVCTNNCVWPGDANNDGIVNNCDILPIGLSLDATGTPRTQPSIYWSPFSAANWSTSLPGNLNTKHADCDGTGTVTTDDFTVFKNHVGFTNPDFQAVADVFTPGDELFVDLGGNIDPNNVQANQTFFVRTKLNLVPGLYGLAFQLDYDKRYFQSFDLLGDGLNIQTDYVEYEEMVEVASLRGLAAYAVVRREDGGQIPEATLMAFSVKASDFPYPLNSYTTEIRIKNIKGMLEDGTEIEIGATPITLNFPSIEVSDVAETADVPAAIYPNPSNGVFEIHLTNEGFTEFKVLDLAGRQLPAMPVKTNDYLTLDLTDYPSGVYFLQLTRQSAVRTSILVVQH